MSTIGEENKRGECMIPTVSIEEKLDILQTLKSQLADLENHIAKLKGILNKYKSLCS